MRESTQVLPPRPPWPCTRELGQARGGDPRLRFLLPGRGPPPPFQPHRRQGPRPTSPSPPSSTRAPAVAVVVNDRVGDPAGPRLPGPFPDRGVLPRVRPHRRPASRRPPWPSPALPCSLPCVPGRKTTRGSILCLRFFFFSSESFSGPASAQEQAGLPAAQPAQRSGAQ